MTGNRGRRGFSLAEIITAVAIIAVMLAVILPTISKRTDDASVTALAQTLEVLRTSIQNFKTHTGEYPGELQQLKTRPVFGNRLCGGTMGAAVSDAWQGPYVAATAGDPGVGIPAGDWVIDNTLTRIPASGLDTGRLYMQVPNMRLADANLLNNEIDGPASEIAVQSAGLDTAGIVTWSSTTAASTTTIFYAMIIAGC